MEIYNYYDAVYNDVKTVLSGLIDFGSFRDVDELREVLSDNLWTADSVTGNGSGSYTFNTWRAEENLCHNLDLLQDAAENFGQDVGDIIKEGPEAADVTIRCYLLDQAIAEYLEDIHAAEIFEYLSRLEELDTEEREELEELLEQAG